MTYRREIISPSTQILWSSALTTLLDQYPPIDEASLVSLGFDMHSGRAQHARGPLQFFARLEPDPPAYNMPIFRVACIDFTLLWETPASYMRFEGRIFKREACGFINDQDHEATSGEAVAFVTEYTIQSLSAINDLVEDPVFESIQLLDLDTPERSLAIQESIAIAKASVSPERASSASSAKLRI